MFCQHCGQQQGQCLASCPTLGDVVKKTVAAELLKFKEAGADVSRRRAGGGSRRGVAINPMLVKVNVTAYPLGMDPRTKKATKLPDHPAINVVFALSATYYDIIDGLASSLFPVPKWSSGATYVLTTGDGAIIQEHAPFCEFPFNLTRSGGKKVLHLVRSDHSQDGFNDNDRISHDYEQGNVDNEWDMTLPDNGEDCGPIQQPLRTIELFGNNNSNHVTGPVIKRLKTGTKGSALVHSSAFGNLDQFQFQDIYQNSKSDTAVQGSGVAILRQFDAQKWSQQFLSEKEFPVPNMEDPITDGESKIVYKEAMFPMVFGSALVVYKVANSPLDDRLGTATRAVQMAALCSQMAIEFNAAVKNDDFMVTFCDSVVVELLPEVIDVLFPAKNNPFNRMCRKGVIWIIERQIKGRFDKFVSNSGNIICLTNKTLARTKKDRIKATAFSHFSFCRSGGEFMALDIQGAGGVYTDVEIVSISNAESTFGIGNMGASSIAKFFQEHECNSACYAAQLERPAGDAFGHASTSRDGGSDTSVEDEKAESDCEMTVSDEIVPYQGQKGQSISFDATEDVIVQEETVLQVQSSSERLRSQRRPDHVTCTRLRSRRKRG